MATPRPALHLQRISARFPKFWRQYEDFRAMRGSGLPDWPTWCYAPLAASYAVVSGGGDNTVPLAEAHLIGELGALAAWRPGKGIYRFDEDLARALLDTPITGDLPREVLHRLPEWCVYVETPFLAPEMQGFFAHLEWDTHDGRTELRVVMDMDGREGPRLASVALHLVEGTLEDSIRAFEAEAAVQWAKAGRPPWVAPQDVTKETAEIVRPLLSLLLYLCSDDADYAGDKRPSRPKPKKTKKGSKLIAANAPVEWDVGVRIGAALRAARRAESDEPDETEGTHASPRPHVRRAHWHTYWTGQGRTVAKLRWISPVLVGGQGTVPTVRKVKPE